MNLHYLVEITKPEHHFVKVTISGKKSSKSNSLNFFMPCWSPGSYLMREYSRNMRSFRALQANGEQLFFEQINKNTWKIDWGKSDCNSPSDEFQISYEAYCHELTVRTSHMDTSHAFLHGPSYLMGIEGETLASPTIEFKFPALWSKLSTGLEDISKERGEFLYKAKDYDDLLDSPVEIGCHETDGFLYKGKPHELAFYGTMYPHQEKIKEDIQTIVDHIAGYMGGIPYEKYCFITHLGKDLYGGLEHKNSTALQFDGRKFGERKDYLNWLSLVAHEYFHLWNVKRIRPKELGPFNYSQENYTPMLWLAEGLTSFMDELFVLRCGLSTLEEYLGLLKNSLDRYLRTPGKKFHSLEDSSFNAWIKLYRPDENSLNSTISYYTKGAWAFFMLNLWLHEKGSSIDHLVAKLWKRYEDNPNEGMATQEFLEGLEVLAGTEVCSKFEEIIQTTVDIDFQKAFEQMGCELEWEQFPEKSYTGMNTKVSEGRILVSHILLDTPAFKCGVNAGDEIIGINGVRVLPSDWNETHESLKKNQAYQLMLSRNGYLISLSLTPGSYEPRLKNIKVLDEEKVRKLLGLKSKTDT